MVEKAYLVSGPIRNLYRDTGFCGSLEKHGSALDVPLRLAQVVSFLCLWPHRALISADNSSHTLLYSDRFARFVHSRGSAVLSKSSLPPPTQEVNLHVWSRPPEWCKSGRPSSVPAQAARGVSIGVAGGGARANLSTSSSMVLTPANASIDR